jgi:hypothetical protein
MVEAAVAPIRNHELALCQAVVLAIYKGLLSGSRPPTYQNAAGRLKICKKACNRLPFLLNYFWESFGAAVPQVIL